MGSKKAIGGASLFQCHHLSHGLGRQRVLPGLPSTLAVSAPPAVTTGFSHDLLLLCAAGENREDYFARIRERLDATQRQDPAFASQPLVVNGQPLAPWEAYLTQLEPLLIASSCAIPPQLLRLRPA